MCDYIRQRVVCLKHIYELNANKFCLILLNAMEGMGKRTAVKAFLNEIGCGDAPTITPYGNIYPLHSFASLFENYVQERERSDKAQIQKYVKDRIFENDAPLIVVFENFNQFDAETAFFVLDLAKMLINIDARKTILFLITYDDTITFELRNQIKNLSRYTSYVHFPDWEARDMTEVLDEVYPNLSISNKSLEQIIACSFKNVGIFLNNIEYLKEQGYICYQGQILKCRAFPPDFFFRNYKEIIQSRYDRLEPTLKDALEKASVVGIHFNAATIENAFHLRMAAQMIKEVELISRLIIQIDISETEFEFVSSETHRLIESYIPDERRDAWNTTLAFYYENQLADPFVYSSDAKFYDCSLLAAFCYENSKQNEKALSLYLKLIPLLMCQSFYRKGLELIAKAQEIALQLGESRSRAGIQLLYWDYQCSLAIFDMDRALKSFRAYRKSVQLTGLEEIRADYQESILLYDGDQTNLAYKRIKGCYDGLQQQKALNKDGLRLKVQVTALLCSIEETLLIDSCQAHFNEAAELARANQFHDLYYSLLRLSGIAYFGEICVKLLRSAARYFSTRDKLEYAMTLHNLASEQLFSNNHSNSLKNFRKAYDIFLECGHNGIVCVRNGLSIYSAIYRRQYQEALEHIYNFATDYNEAFLKLTIYYNTVTLLRKLGRLREAKKYFSKAVSLNKRKENKYPYFTRFLLAQEGYIALENDEPDKAWDCFEKFFYHAYADRIEYSLSIAITMAELAGQMGWRLPPEVRAASRTQNENAKYLSEERLIFCEILFWE